MCARMQCVSGVCIRLPSIPTRLFFEHCSWTIFAVAREQRVDLDETSLISITTGHWARGPTLPRKLTIDWATFIGTKRFLGCRRRAFSTTRFRFFYSPCAHSFATCSTRSTARGPVTPVVHCTIFSLARATRTATFTRSYHHKQHGEEKQHSTLAKVQHSGLYIVVVYRDRK